MVKRAINLFFNIRLGRVCKSIFSRTIFLYCGIAVLVSAFVDPVMAKLARVNFLQEEAVYLPIYLNHRASFDPQKFRLTKKYYQAFIGAISFCVKYHVDLRPAALSRAYAMMAICDYYLGNLDQSLQYFKKAAAIEPKHFWLNYDLGLVYFKKGQYAQAAEHFKKSLALTTQDHYASMALDHFHQWPADMAQKYESFSAIVFFKMIKDSYQMAILAYDRMNNPSIAKSLAVLALSAGIDEHSGFFQYYAGKTRQKPSEESLGRDLLCNPSLAFLPVGQEEIFEGEEKGLFKIQNHRVITEEKN